MKNVRDTGFEFGSIANMVIGTWAEDDGKGYCHWCGRPFQAGQRVQDTLTRPPGKPEYHTLVHIDDDYCENLRVERNKAIAKLTRLAMGDLTTPSL